MCLDNTGILTYYKVAGQRKKAGACSLHMCTAIVPGGRCPINWYANANPGLCLGIICMYRTMYVFADSKDELQAWLQAFSLVVPDSVRIPTVAEVSMAARLAIPLPVPASATKKVVTVMEDGSRGDKKAVELLPEWEGFLTAAGNALGIVVKRIFNDVGGEFSGWYRCAVSSCPDGQPPTRLILVFPGQVPR